MLFRPLPEHLNYDRVGNSLVAEKDVDAMTTINSGLVYDGSACLLYTSKEVEHIPSAKIKEIAKRNLQAIAEGNQRDFRF